MRSVTIPCLTVVNDAAVDLSKHGNIFCNFTSRIVNHKWKSICKNSVICGVKSLWWGRPDDYLMVWVLLLHLMFLMPVWGEVFLSLTKLKPKVTVSSLKSMTAKTVVCTQGALTFNRYFNKRFIHHNHKHLNKIDIFIWNCGQRFIRHHPYQRIVKMMHIVPASHRSLSSYMHL